MCCKSYPIIFSTFPLKFRCKICVQKQVIHNFKKHILVMWPATNFNTHFKKMVRVSKTKSLLLCLRYDLLIVFQRQNRITFICIKANTWPISANGLCIPCENSRMERAFSSESFQRENRTTFSKFYLFLGRLQWNAWQTCVPLIINNRTGISWEMESAPVSPSLLHSRF